MDKKIILLILFTSMLVLSTVSAQGNGYYNVKDYIETEIGYELEVVKPPAQSSDDENFFYIYWGNDEEINWPSIDMFIEWANESLTSVYTYLNRYAGAGRIYLNFFWFIASSGSLVLMADSGVLVRYPIPPLLYIGIGVCVVTIILIAGYYFFRIRE